MSQCTVATLGPNGSFSSQSVVTIANFLKTTIGDFQVEYDFSISNLFRKSISIYDAIVVPLENSETGILGTTVDWLIKTNKEGVEIVGELDLKINHFLGGWGSISNIRKIYAHPQAISQCESFLNKNIPDFEYIQTSSNSESACLIALNKGDDCAGIIPKICSETKNIPIISKNIQNSEHNTTRFIICTRNPIVKANFQSKNYSKTSILIDPQSDYPGLLHDILKIFKRYDINLTRIDSRPSKRRFGEYMFYIDLQGGLISPHLNPCLQDLREKTIYRILGCYNPIKTF